MTSDDDVSTFQKKNKNTEEIFLCRFSDFFSESHYFNVTRHSAFFFSERHYFNVTQLSENKPFVISQNTYLFMQEDKGFYMVVY